MSTLRAGSYLNLLRDPEMDLMDVVDEEVPVTRTRTSSESNGVQFEIYRSPVSDPSSYDVRKYDMPTWWYKNTITDEKTHGLRFGNCSHEHRQLVVSPYGSEPPARDANTHEHQSDPDNDVKHYLFSSYKTTNGRPQGRIGVDDYGFGIIHWDYGVDNELYPGYPGEPAHLPLDGEDDLDVEEELVRAYDTIRPTVTSDMSLLVTIAEIKDVWTLVSQPIALINKVSKLVGRKKAKHMTLLGMLKDPDLLSWLGHKIPEGYLYDKFGLEQTKRDLCTLGSFYIQLDSAVREILSATGTHTRHYSCPIFKGHSSRIGVEFQDHNWIIQRQWYTTLTRKFVVTMKYTTELVDAYGQSINPNDRGLVKLGLAMDKLGLNMNPAIIWDLVPFSFVVDYFVHIGDWLERFKRSNLNLTFGVLDSCYSVRRQAVTEGITRRWTSTWNGITEHPNDPYLARDEFVGGLKFNYTTTGYDRTRFLPTLRMLSGLREPEITARPTTGQLMILGSLLTANIPTRRK